MKLLWRYVIAIDPKLLEGVAEMLHPKINVTQAADKIGGALEMRFGRETHDNADSGAVLFAAPSDIRHKRGNKRIRLVSQAPGCGMNFLPGFGGDSRIVVERQGNGFLADTGHLRDFPLGWRANHEYR
jgi:hypothetical protein